MGWLLALILGGILVALLLRSNAENSYRRGGFEDSLKARRRQDSIDVEYKVIEPDEKRSP